ncbi:MAG: SseB family protein [Bdellovibrionales bacterium]|nr:SseB family protein [Bdellovibrionales bacterium]
MDNLTSTEESLTHVDSFARSLKAYHHEPSGENLQRFFNALRETEVILPITSVQLVVDGEDEELYEYSPLMALGRNGEDIMFVFFGSEGFNRFTELNRLSAKKFPEVEAMQLPAEDLYEIVSASEWDVITFDTDGPIPLTFSRQAFETYSQGDFTAYIEPPEEPEPVVEGKSRRGRGVSGIFRRILGG